MKKALIFQNIIVDVVDNEFPVSPEMVWIDVDDDVTTRHQYNEDGTISPPPAPSIESIRERRDYLLAESDWTLGLDSPLSEEKKQEWIIYRQELRDITKQANTFNIIWPIPPS